MTLILAAAGVLVASALAAAVAARSPRAAVGFATSGTIIAAALALTSDRHVGPGPHRPTPLLVLTAVVAGLLVVRWLLGWWVRRIDLDTLVAQCRSAVVWVHGHAGELGGDPRRIFVSGHSAGGHLVAMLLATDWAALGAPADVVKGGCAISGLYDLEPIRLCYLNDVLALTPDAARRNSPVLLPRPATGSLLLAVGGDEGPEYHRQTNDLAAAWRGGGGALEVLDMAGHDHFSIVGELESPVSPLARAIQRQMGLA